MSRFKPENLSCPPLFGMRHRRTKVAKRSTPPPALEESGRFAVVRRHEPQPGVDYPESEDDLDEMFASEVDVHRYLERIRYPRGFVCGGCGDRATPWRSGTGLLACSACRQPAPLRAGTLFQENPLPLRQWIRGLWTLAASETSIAAAEFAPMVGVDEAEARRLLCHIRAAMARADAPPLEGHVYVATSRLAEQDGCANARSPLIAMAVDVERTHRPRVRLRQLERVTSREIQRFVVDAVAPCSKVVTAPWRGFSLITDSGYEHEVRDKPPSKMGAAKSDLGPGDVWALLRLWVWWSNAECQGDLQPALDEFTFRFNRRHYRPGQLFYRLMRVVAEVDDDGVARPPPRCAAS